MATSRTYAELMGLEVEAERLVRMGESRAEVSRRLGVHPMTLAGWALRGGWRKKDLDMERAAEATRETILAIRRGNQAADARDRLRAEMSRVLRAALRIMAEEGEDAMERAMGLLETLGPAARLEAPPRARLAPDPRATSRSLGDAEVDSSGDGADGEAGGEPPA
jgi:hypothetical protein